MTHVSVIKRVINQFSTHIGHLTEDINQFSAHIGHLVEISINSANVSVI
ncbi:hypothetical protein WD019_18015 [Fictibacillus sp. Mic-4]